MNRPVAVLISDLHFTPGTLEIASEALEAAAKKAEDLNVSLIIAGDTLDTKDIIRGVCANRLLKILESTIAETYIIVGNHDLLNEKGTEHALNFLGDRACIVDRPVLIDPYLRLFPYYNDSDKLKNHMDGTVKGATLIMHQGVQTAYMGHYVQDKTSLPKETFADYRVISGHYHRRQDIKCGRVSKKGFIGLFSYVGSPYTTSFAEANDGPKGFCVLYENGALEQIPLNLRKHVILERTIEDVYEPDADVNPNDLLWLKVKGPQSLLSKLKKAQIGKALLGHSNFKLDLISTDISETSVNTQGLTDSEVFDSLIDGIDETPTQKATLKALYRDLIKDEKLSS